MLRELTTTSKTLKGLPTKGSLRLIRGKEDTFLVLSRLSFHIVTSISRKGTVSFRKHFIDVPVPRDTESEGGEEPIPVTT